MRRGLISRSKAELPDAVLDARLARVRAAMDAAGLDALLLYTNNTRAAGVSWLTGFVPYWSEALLVVPRDREPVLVAALSYRVKSWIERTSRLAEVIHGPRIGLEVAKLIAPVRAEADPAEIALAMRAAAIAQHALAQTPGRGASLGESIAAIEAQARTDGAEEVYVAAAPDLDRDRRLRRIEGEAALGESFALRATIAYKGAWIRLTRTFLRDGAVYPQKAAVARLAAAVAKLPSSDGFAGFSSWLVEGCRIAQPLEPLMGSRVATAHPLAPSALVSVQADFEIEGRPLLLGAPALVGRRGEAASLLVPPF